MPSLKEFRNRIASVKSTRKITSAMKMVAGAKLRRAQQKAEENRAYTSRMAKMIVNIMSDMKVEDKQYPLISGNGRDNIHLLIVLTSDNGLCGSFNSALIRLATKVISKLIEEKKTVKIISIGRKGSNFFKKSCPKNIIKNIDDFSHRNIAFKDASELAQEVLTMFAEEKFDNCTIIYNQFKSVIMQKPITKKLIPFDIKILENEIEVKCEKSPSSYIFEPSREEIFEELLPLNFALQLYKAILDNSAGEKAARMTAMDSATNNANTMINNLTLKYNRARQAYITKELIEIISGAEAV